MPIKDLTLIDRHVFMCKGGSCSQQDSPETIVALRREIEGAGLQARVHTTCTLCNGRCDDGPVVIVIPDGIWYKHVTPRVARRIVKEHLMHNRPVETHILYRYGDASVLSESVPEV